MSNKTLSSRGRQEAQSKRAGRFRGSSINLFYLPAVILLAVFIVYPLFSGIGLSLTNWDGYSPEKTFIGLTNFAQMFKDANFRLILINTLIYGVGSTAIQQVLGLGVPAQHQLLLPFGQQLDDFIQLFGAKLLVREVQDVHLPLGVFVAVRQGGPQVGLRAVQPH